MSQPHILVVEDETVARRILHVMLTQAGYEVTSVGSGEEAMEELQQHAFDLLLTDLQLRKVGGIEVMTFARDHDPNIEVIVLTGYATIDSAIASVRHGAHNYIMKPGQPGEIERSVAEALAKRKQRMDRVDWLRRMGEGLIQLAENAETALHPASTPAEPPLTIFQVGDLTIDIQRHLVTRHGSIVPLSRGDFKLLEYLLRHREQVVSAQQIVREMLGYECSRSEARDLIKSRIWSLRRKLEPDPATPQLIISVRGVGYMLTCNQQQCET